MIAKTPLKILRTAEGGATLKIAGKTLMLTAVGDASFVAHKGLPDLPAVAKAALIAPTGLAEELTPEALFVQVRANDEVSEVYLHTRATGAVGLSEVLPRGVDRSKGRDHPAGAAELAFQCRSSDFEFRFEVGTNRMAIACAAQVPMLDGSTTSGKTVVGLTFPLKDAGHSIGFEWDDQPQSVLFNEVLQQIGAEDGADQPTGMPKFRLKPQAITHLNGGDTRCRVTWLEPGRYAVDGMVEVNWRAQKIWRTRVTLDAAEDGAKTGAEDASSATGVALSDLLATSGVPHIAGLPKVIAGIKITSLSADLDLESRFFDFTGGTSDVFGQTADLALTYRSGATPSAYVRADLHGGAAKSIHDLAEILGLQDSLAGTLPYVPLTNLPLQVRSFGIDTQGPGVFGKFRLGDAAHWADLDVAFGKTADGPLALLSYRAPEETAQQVSLSDALGSDLMPDKFRTQLNALTRFGEQESRVAKVLLSTVLNEVDLRIAKTKDKGISTTLKGVATVAGLPLRTEINTITAGADQGIRLSFGTVPNNYVTLEGLVKTFGISVDVPTSRLPRTRFAVQDFTLDTARKSVRLRGVAVNGYDPAASNLGAYNCVVDMDVAKRGKGLDLTCAIDASAGPIGLRGLAHDLQLSQVTEFLKGKGDLLLKTCALKLSTSKNRVEMTCGGEIAFGDLIRAAGIPELPQGIPTTLALDGFTLIVEGKDKVTVKGAIELKGARKELFELSQDAKLQIARLDISMVRDKKKFDAKVALSGKPQWDLTDDLRFESYDFKLAYGEAPKEDKPKEDGPKKDGPKTAKPEKPKPAKDKTWALSGTLKAHLFGSREIEMGLSVQRGKEGRKITFDAAAEKLAQLELTVARVVRAIDVSPQDAGKILAALKDAKHIDKNGVLAKGFDPDAKGFDLGLPDSLQRHADDVLAFLMDASALFSVSVEGQKLAAIEPRRVKLVLDHGKKERTTSLEISSDLKLYAPFVKEPLFSLDKGSLALEHKSKSSETTICFKADNAVWNVPIMPKITLPNVVETGDPKKGLDEVETTQSPNLNVHFGAITFRKTKKKWKIGGSVELEFREMPRQFDDLIGERPTLEIAAGSTGLTLSGTDMFQPVEFADLGANINEAAGGTVPFPLPELGKAAAHIKKMDLSLSRDVSLGLEFGIALPSQLNEALGMGPDGVQLFKTWAQDTDGMIMARVDCSTKKVSGQFYSSPFNDNIPGIKVEKEGDKLAALDINFDQMFGTAPDGKAYGTLKVKMPSIGLNVNNGSFFADGGYEFDAKTGLRIPLKPLKTILKLFQLDDVANALPDGFPIKTRKLNKAGITELLRDVGIPPNPIIGEILNGWDQSLDWFPTRFRDYMQLSVPNKLRFEIAITSDAGVSFEIAAGKRGGSLCEGCETCEAGGICDTDPDYGLQLMMPTMMGLQGMKFWKLSIGAAFGGAALKGEIDADIDLFDYPSLLASLTILGDPKVPRAKQPAFVRALPERSELQRTMVIDDFSYLVIIATIIPVPVPLFYRELSVVSHGIEDMRVEMAVNFPKPSFDLVEAVSFFADAYKTFTVRDAYFDGVRHPIDITARTRDETAAPKSMNLTFSAGPIYARLPRYMKNDGELIVIGAEENYQLFDFLNLIKLLWNGGKKLIVGEGPGYLMQAIDIKYRQQDLMLRLFEGVEARASWALATPKEFATGKDIRFGNVTDQRGVADRILTLIGNTEQPLLEGKPAPVSDNGVVLFLHGGFDIKDIMHFVAEGGLMMSPQHGGMMALRLDGRIGPAENALFRAEFDGALIAGKSTPNRDGGTSVPMRLDQVPDPTLRVQGNAMLEILGKQIMTGKLDFAQGEAGAQISVVMKAGQPDGLLCVMADLKGEMTRDRFALSGKGAMRIAMIESQGSFDILAAPDCTKIGMCANLEVGPLFSMGFALSAQEADSQTELKLCFQAELLSLVKIKATGAFRSGDKLELSGALKLVEQEVLSGAMIVTDTACEFEGQLTLIPDTPALALGAWCCGTITKSSAQFEATGHYRFGFVEGAVVVCLDVPDPSTGKPQQLSLTFQKFLNTDVNVVMMACAGGNGGTLQLSTTVTKPLPLLGDHVKLIDATTGTKGPSVNLELNGAGNAFGVQKFELDGALSVLGMKSTTRLLVNAEREELNATLMITPPRGLSLPRAGVNFVQTRDCMRVSAKDVSLKVDIASALAKIIEDIGFGTHNLGALSAEVSMKNMSFEVNRNLTDNPADKEAEKRARDARKRLADLNRLFMAQQSTLDDLNERLTKVISQLPHLTRHGIEVSWLFEQTKRAMSAKSHLSIKLSKYKDKTEKLLEYDKNAAKKVDRLGYKNGEISVFIQQIAVIEEKLRRNSGASDFDLHVKVLTDGARKFPNEALKAANANSAADKIFHGLRHQLWHSYWGVTDRANSKREFYSAAKVMRNNLFAAIGGIDEQIRDIEEVKRKLYVDREAQAKKDWDTAVKDAKNLLVAGQDYIAKRILEAAESKRDAEFDAYKGNLKVAKTFGTPSKLGIAAATGYRVHVQAKVQVKLTVGGTTRTFDFLDVNWQVDDIGGLDPHKSILDTLPEVILTFLQDNFLTVVGKAISNLFELFDFIQDLIKQAGSPKGLAAAGISNIDTNKMVAGYCQVDPAYAGVLAKQK